MEEIYFSSGLFYGYGVFETLRVYNGKPFLLKRHVERLLKGAEILGIEHPPRGEIENLCFEKLKGLDFENIRLRITLTPKNLRDGIYPEGHLIFISARKYSPPPEEKYKTGYRLAISKIRRNETSPNPLIKSISYVENILAFRDARERGYDEAIFLNTKGFLTEGTRTNIFIVRDGVLITPRPSDGLLKGITRDFVIELAGEKGIETCEGEIKIEELFSADEVFITNSLIEIMPVSRIEDVEIKCPGDTALSLLHEYRRRCG